MDIWHCFTIKRIQQQIYLLQIKYNFIGNNKSKYTMQKDFLSHWTILNAKIYTTSPLPFSVPPFLSCLVYSFFLFLVYSSPLSLILPFSSFPLFLTFYLSLLLHTSLFLSYARVKRIKNIETKLLNFLWLWFKKLLQRCQSQTPFV